MTSKEHECHINGWPSDKSMVEKQSLETGHKIHADETVAFARTSEYTNHLEKEATGTQLYPHNFQHV
jgi:hypothetical protein